MIISFQIDNSPSKVLTIEFKKLTAAALLLLSILVWPTSQKCLAQDAEITGQLYHYTGYAIKSEGNPQRVLAERNMLNLFAETETGRFTWFAEIELATDLGYLGETSVSSSMGFQQVYLNYADDYFDASVGLQAVNWGFANGLYGLDVLQVFDLADALTQDYTAIRQATWSGLFKYYPTSNSSIDLYLSPGAHAAGLPDPDSPWGLASILPFQSDLLNFLDDDLPDYDYSKPEVAIRYNFQSDLADYSITFMDVYSRLPAISIQALENGLLNIQNHYERNKIAGGSISTSALDPVIVGLEIAHSFDALVPVSNSDAEQSSIPPGFQERNVSNFILSLVNSNSFFEGQVAVSLRSIQQHDATVLQDRTSMGISASLTRTFLDDKARIEFQGLSPDFKQHWIQGGIRYSISDRLSLFTGAQFYGGEVDLQDRSFPLALYGQKDLVFIEALYSF